MNPRWNTMTTRDRIINVLVIILSVAVIALAALQLLGIWEDAINVAVCRRFCVYLWVCDSCTAAAAVIRRECYGYLVYDAWL